MPAKAFADECAGDNPHQCKNWARQAEAVVIASAGGAEPTNRLEIAPNGPRVGWTLSRGAGGDLSLRPLPGEPRSRAERTTRPRHHVVVRRPRNALRDTCNLACIRPPLISKSGHCGWPPESRMIGLARCGLSSTCSTGGPRSPRSLHTHTHSPTSRSECHIVMGWGSNFEYLFRALAGGDGQQIGVMTTFSVALLSLVYMFDAQRGPGALGPPELATPRRDW